MKGKFVLIASIAVIALLLGACAPQAAPQATAPEAKQITIGMANFSQCCAYFIGMNKAVIDAAKAYGNVTIISTDANGDAAKLNSDIEDLIAKKVDGIIISGAWLEQLPSAMDSINKAGIPAVLVDRQWKSGYTSYVGPENFKIGQQNGQYIVDRLGGKGVLVVLKGGPADNSIGLNRTNGMLDIVTKATGITVINAPDWGGWSEDGGLKQMENLLAANKKIDAVFCENDSMCLGAKSAIGDAGKKDQIIVTAVDGQKEALKEILDGTNYAATGLNNSDQIGRAGFHRILGILAGGKPEKDSVLPSPIIKRDNVVKFYNPDSIF